MSEILNDIHRTVGALDAKVDILLRDRSSLDARVRTLEKKWSFGLGLYTAVSAVTAFVFAHIKVPF